MTTTLRSETFFASTLPGRYYYNPVIYEQEQERIFSQMWVCVGHSEAFTSPGAYRVVTVGKESVIVVRNRENVLQAFLNVCRHRGSRLCTEAVGQLKGSIQCKYHAWTYDLDGRLIGAPNVLNNEHFERTAYGLVPVALEIWQGLIWLHLAEKPTPVAAQLDGPILERFGSYVQFDRYGIGNLRVGKTISYDVQANWKLLLENFMECYHCGPMHPELCQLLPAFRSGKADYVDGEAATLIETVEAFTITGKASRPPLSGLLLDDMRSYYGLVLTPNVLLNLLPDHVVLHTLWPEGPTRTRVVCDWLFEPEVMSRTDFDPMDAVQIFDIVNKQDWEVCELAQLGVTSKAFQSGGIYVPSERHLRAFADLVLEKLEG
ncbi:MAG: aromatic ring-hydroxylating dioxygenase subunit alpha [Ktedonobacteraceae bacterium]